MTDHFATAMGDVYSGYKALKPPRRVSVSQGAANNLVIKQPGQAGGPWSATETPYMSGPMDMLASRSKKAVVFVGPARTGKTAGLLLGWLAHNVVNDPGDMLLMQMTKDKAREFSKTDVDRALLHSPNIAALRSPRITDSNTFDTMFLHGMWLRIAWPTISNVSGSTYRYVGVTDYDRIANAENVDGEGSLFQLILKRTTTFLSRGKALVESSPGVELTDPSWKPATRHEAPPVTGVLGIYNLSDRSRWYWQCPDCKDHFEATPGMGLFNLPPDEELIENIRELDIAKLAKDFGRRIICPHCSSLVTAEHKNKMNTGGIWLPDGQIIDDTRAITGVASESSIGGYWLGGVAAAYQSWKSLVENHLNGLRDYALTGSEESLKATINTDQGMPYMSRHLVESSRNREKSGALDESAMQRYVVPAETRCLIASVDVQGGVASRFIVQIHAVGPYREQWLVDRFEIKKSTRPGMGEEFAQIDPASYPEDWDVLTDKLLRATWRTPIEGREIRLKLLVVDSGGEDGVTASAYAWFRRVRKAGMASRVRLYKGASTKEAPVTKESLVGRRNTREKGDIPLLVCNPNLLSDIVDSGLKRATPGPGYIHFPPVRHPANNPGGWLPQAFFDELTAEVRQDNGVWKQIRKRNETFDLCRMVAAGMLYLGLDKLRDWNIVPPWLAPLDQNSEVIYSEDRRAMQDNTPVASEGAGEVRVVRSAARRPRRSSVSSYIR